MVESVGFDEAIQGGRAGWLRSGAPLQRAADEDRSKAERCRGAQVRTVRGDHPGLLGRALEQAERGEVHLRVGLVAAG